jgi:hypothetical protein
MIDYLDEHGRVRVFSCRVLDFYYIDVFSLFRFYVVVLYPGVAFRVRACVALL